MKYKTGSKLYDAFNKSLTYYELYTQLHTAPISIANQAIMNMF